MTIRPHIAIVGSGLAGALLAGNIKQWADVTLFERGGAAPSYPGRPALTGHPLGLYPTHAYGLGGTTNLWRGGLLAMHPNEYNGHWPVRIQLELDRYQAEAIRALYGNALLKCWLAARGKQDPSAPFVDVIIQPKRPFRVTHSDLLLGVTLKLEHYVEQIEEIGDRVAIDFKYGASCVRSYFQFVVLSAGGLSTPLILHRSSLGGEAVGNNITDHPVGFVASVTRERANTSFEKLSTLPFGTRVLKVRDTKTGLWSTFHLCPTHDPSIASDPYVESFKTIDALDRLCRFASIISKLRSSEYRRQMGLKLLRKKRLGVHAYVLVFSEQEALGQGSIRHDLVDRDVSFHWAVSDHVTSAIDRSLVRLAEWLGVELHVAPGGLRNRLWSAAHHSGGCRISEDCKVGVVDSDLRVLGTKRVFACDGSVLPSTGSSNTGLTIAALALRLASQLEQEHA